jgi:hypothetical protein
MDVRVHQTEGEDDHLIATDRDIDPVHSGDEIVIIEKHLINGIAVGAEVPAVLDCNLLTFGERDIESQIGNDLPEQFFFYLHLQIQRRLWLPAHKDNISSALCQAFCLLFFNPIFVVHKHLFR